MTKKEERYIAIDLGTCNTRINISGLGLIFNQATILIKNLKNGKILHYGDDAKNYIGKTTNDQMEIFPINAGVINDFYLLNIYIKKAFNSYEKELRDSVITISCPSGLSAIEKSYLIKLIERFGAKQINVEDDIKLAMLGAKSSIMGSEVYLGINIGGGSTTIATVVGGEIIAKISTRKAGNEFTNDIAKIVRQKYSVLIGITSSEEIKKKAVSLLKENKKLNIFGYDINSGLPTNVDIDGNIFNKLVVDYFEEYTKLITELLEKTPKEAIKDICKNGIIVTGGLSNIKGVKEYFENYFNIPVHHDPKESISSTINGIIKYNNILKENQNNSKNNI